MDPRNMNMEDVKKAQEEYMKKQEEALKEQLSENAFKLYKENQRLAELSNQIGQANLQEHVADHHEAYKEIQKEQLRLQILDLDNEEEKIEKKLPKLVKKIQVFNKALEDIISEHQPETEETT